MINLTYSKGILDMLFHTGGTTGMTADDELTAFKNEELVFEFQLPDSTTVWGVSAEKYKNAYQSDLAADNVGDSDSLTAEYDEKQNQIKNKSTWWEIETYSEFLTYKYTNNDGDLVNASKSFTGWYLKHIGEQKKSYPSGAYLALFTQMPNEFGEGYEEPVAETTYIRVNLHEDLITGSDCLNDAQKDEEDGKSFVSNNRNIMFPEVCDLDWGNIVGFGIFENEDRGSGAPVLWGRLKNENGIQASVDNVPLFRTNEFQINLQ